MDSTHSRRMQAVAGVGFSPRITGISRAEARSYKGMRMQRGRPAS
jgi:hypothetical protein